MSVTIKLDGGEELLAAIDRLGDQVKDNVSKAVLATALELQSNIKKNIHHGPATGRVYRKYSPKRIHQASAVGQFPATDTGRLANSITFDKENDYTATVGSALTYARMLEYKMPSRGGRPFFRPAVEEIRETFGNRLLMAIEKATR